MNIIFLHLPKTAGTTFNFIIERNFSRDRIIEIPFEYYDDWKYMEKVCQGLVGENHLIRGHMLFGIHQFLSSEYKYLVFFRDPVDRFISQYYYMLRHPSHYLHDHASKLSLEEFIDSSISTTMFNSQTKLLAGWNGVECDEEVLEKALINLHHKHLLIGLTGEFDQSLVVMRHSFPDFKDVRYISKNINPDKDGLRVAQSTIEKIKARNHYDIKIYRQAQELFAAQMESIEEVDRQIHQLRSENRVLKRNTAYKNYIGHLVKRFFP